jgi:hypothetical protein
MDPAHLIRGKTYYRLTFADPDLTLPGVEPLVFVGLVQTDDDEDETYCFQDTVSFVRFGYVTEHTGGEELAAIFVPDREIGSIYSLEGIASEIQDALRRAKDRGEPELKQAKGPWI